MTKGNLNRLQKSGNSCCRKCHHEFNENDVIATTTSRRYCYDCAIVINLVTGKIENDLDVFLLPKPICELKH